VVQLVLQQLQEHLDQLVLTVLLVYLEIAVHLQLLVHLVQVVLAHLQEHQVLQD
jgi:hypothetical protein